MHIFLNEFEQIVDEAILKRGWAYFKKGAILAFSETDAGEYEAIISGTDDYRVQLKIEDNTITEHYCNCPYDLGAVCKHLVATIFYLKQEDLRIASRPKKTKKKKTTSVAQQIKELLKAISHQELVDFVAESSKKDKQFSNYFFATFGHLSQNQSKEFYREQIHSILKTAAGREGWIDWADMKYVFHSTQPLLENADNCFKNGNFENVFSISTALLEEMTKAFQFGDDSHGDIGYFVESAMELLLKLAQEKLPETLKKEIFEYCISSFNKKIFEDWDWHLGMLKLACKLVEKESEADTILNCLNSISEEYEIEQSQSIKFDLLQRFKEEKELDEYISQNISNSLIRTKVIELAFSNENFEKVIALSEDGIKHDEKSKPGLVKVWYNWLLKVAQTQKDTSKIIEYSRFLFIDNFYPEQDYYQILKNTVHNEDWSSFLEQLIVEITSKNSWTYVELIRKIYIKEEWWDRLFLMLKENPSLDKIEQNETYLAKDYAPELIALYTERILKYAEDYVGRKHYQTACRYLRRMKKLGGTEEVNVMIEFLRKKYSQRKALLDELNKV